MFANARRKELKALYPDRPYPAIQSDISVEWDQMDDESKEPWKKAMERDKERYKKQMDLYRKYGPNWVWVVGHLMRRDLGLTVEDCTKVEFVSSTEDQRDSPRPPSTKDEGFAKRKGHRDNQAAKPRRSGYQIDLADGFSPVSMSAQSTTSSSQNLEDYQDSNIQYYGIPIPMSHETRDDLDHYSQRRGDTVPSKPESNAQKPLRHSYLETNFEDALFQPGQHVDIFAPTVFDGFGLEVPWSESYEWYDQ
ncbi:hypothetical protein TWF281_008279 [Arthrobotrys megalospora]